MWRVSTVAGLSCEKIERIWAPEAGFERRSRTWSSRFIGVPGSVPARLLPLAFGGSGLLCSAAFLLHLQAVFQARNPLPSVSATFPLLNKCCTAKVAFTGIN